MSGRRDGFDFDGTLHVLRDNVARADALITAAENLIERSWSDSDCQDDSDDGVSRRRNHVAHLIESAKLAVRGAIYAGDQLDLHRDLRRKGA